MRRRGVVIRVLVVLGVAVVVLLGAARWYLSSRHAANQVQARLAETLGTRVRIEAVNLGFGGRSTLAGLRVYETDAAPDDEPLLTAAAVETDASAWELVRGERPRDVLLLDPHLVLRFDESGRLVSRLPRAGEPADIPHFVVGSGTVTLKQQGRPDLVVGGVTADLSPDGNDLLLVSDFDDPRWGKGHLTGDYDGATGVVEGTLKTGEVHLTADELAALPFVPAETWRQVRCEGDTTAEIRLRIRTRGTAPGAVRYRVALAPRRTKVHVTAIGLTADDALGRVTIEDDVVRLEGVEGRTAGGTISTGAFLDFRRPVSDLRFDLAARKLDLQQLPKAWKLPPLVGGNLSGTAELRVTVEGERPRTAGRGEGEVAGVSVLGFEAREPIRLRIVADGEGFHFDLPRPARRDTP